MKKILPNFHILSVLLIIVSIILLPKYANSCVQLDKLPIWEPFGPTDVNAASGNGGLSVLFNSSGTVTVFKWPNPGYYDHVKYFTTDRSKPRMGALPNEGVFSGIYVETDKGAQSSWFRDWNHEQRYFSPGEAIVETTFTHEDLGLTVVQTDWVDPARDVLHRKYNIFRKAGSPVKLAKLVVYANFNPVVTKMPYLPIPDWCIESLYDSEIQYDPESDAFVQYKEGVDSSTKKLSSVAIAMGLDKKLTGYQAGNDALVLFGTRNKPDAYKLMRSGKLNGSTTASGQVTAGLMTDVDFSEQNSWEGAAYFSVTRTRNQALKLLKESRRNQLEDSLKIARQFWQRVLAQAALPDTNDARILEVAKVSLMSLRLAFSRDTGAVSAGISTQPPYGPDWPSNGAYINMAFLKAGWQHMALAHNRFYARHQSGPRNPLWRVPFGNWHANMFADGVPGMPIIPWEIDETGFTLWNLWNYYEATGDRAYLKEIYPNIRLTANFLTRWRDPKSGLQRRGHEVDNVMRTQTVFGAATTCLGLKKASLAAEVLGRDDDRAKWSARYEELRGIILNKVYNPEKRCFVMPPFDSPASECDYNGLYVIWPAELIPPDDPRASGHADALWEMMQPRLNGTVDRGSYESMTWLALAKAWKHDLEKLKRVQKALAWNARVPTTSTGHLGEVWLKIGNKVQAGESQPQLWNHALFYLATLEAFGEKK